jgi:uncharacterized membrane protein YhfC
VNILFLTYPLNALLIIAMPVGLAIYLTRKFKLSWKLWWIGGFTFILSQVAHIPFNFLVLNPQLRALGESSLPEPLPLVLTALALGLSAGLFEEFARYGMYRWWAKDARSWGRGLLLGAGHGGMEAILLGVLVLYGFLQLLALRNADLATVVPVDQLALAKAQVEAYWSANWYDSLLGALERAFTIPFQIAASVLVLQVFIRKQMRWLWLAVAWHTIVDAGAVAAVPNIGPYLTEALIGVFALISLFIIFRLRQPEPIEPPEVDLTPLPPPLSAAVLKPVEESDTTLEHSRYDSN